MTHSRIDLHARHLHIIPALLLSVFLITSISGCTEIPTSPLSRPLGIGTIQDVAKNDQDVFFFEDFEDDSYEKNFSRGSHADNRQLVSGDVVFNGKKSLRISVNRNSNYGTSLSYRFSDVGMKEPTELYARYYLRFDESWNTSRGSGKLPGPAGRYDRGGWGGRASNGTNGWSARMEFGRSWMGPELIDLSYYTYHAYMPEKYGDNMPWDKDNRGTLKKNRWYCVETYVKLNTPGETDGILRGWVDGYLAMEETDIMFRSTPDLKIEEFWFDIYYGGHTAPSNMHLYIDNLALSTRRIGTATGSDN